MQSIQHTQHSATLFQRPRLQAKEVVAYLNDITKFMDRLRRKRKT